MEKIYKKVIIASAIGGALECYDFILFILFAKIISEIFVSPQESPFIAMLTIYSIFATGYFVRPIGGIILAHFGDRYGRKKVFTFTVFLMAVSTVLIGLIPTYASIGVLAPLALLILRICQGLAFGGEIPGSSTFVYEHMPEHKKTTGIAVLMSGTTAGILLGSVIGLIVAYLLNEKSLMLWGWRIPFLIGGLLGIIGVYIRKKLWESPVFIEMEKYKAQLRIPFGELLKTYKGSTIACIFTTTFMASCSVTFYMYLPSYLGKFYGVPTYTALAYNTFGLIVFVISITIWGIVADITKTDPKVLFKFSAIIVIIFAIPFFVLLKYHHNNEFLMVVLYLILGVMFAPISSSSTMLIAKSFPGVVRFTGIAASFNISQAVFASLTPIINTVLIEKLQSTIAPAYLVIFTAVIGLVATFAVKYTKEIPLSQNPQRL